MDRCRRLETDYYLVRIGTSVRLETGPYREQFLKREKTSWQDHNSGGTSYILLAEIKRVRGTLATLERLYRKWLYGFISGGIGAGRQISRHLTQITAAMLDPAPVNGSTRQGSEGSFVIPHDSEGTGFWLEQAYRNTATYKNCQCISGRAIL